MTEVLYISSGNDRARYMPIIDDSWGLLCMGRLTIRICDRMDGKGQKGNYRRGKMSKIEIIQMSKARSKENDSGLK